MLDHQPTEIVDTGARGSDAPARCNLADTLL
jgi:hypothetical protein